MILSMDLSKISEEQFENLKSGIKLHFSISYDKINDDINEFWSKVDDNNDVKLLMCKWRDAARYISDNVDYLLSRNQESTIDLSSLAPMQVLEFEHFIYNQHSRNNNLRQTISEFILIDETDIEKLKTMKLYYKEMNDLICSMIVQFKKYK